MTIRDQTRADEVERQRIASRVEDVRLSGECPTCRNALDGSVYPSHTDRLFYEDQTVLCLLEKYPRALGHTIVLVKQHREDVSELEDEEIGLVYLVIHRCVWVLKKVFHAEKVYVCTMCDGTRNHLHYQLIPRFEGDDIRGSKLFVKPRQVLIAAGGLLGALRQAMAQ